MNDPSNEPMTAKEKLQFDNTFRIYSGDELMRMEFPPKEWLIEGLIFRGDSVLLVGDAKSGKSLLIQSAICSLTSGGVFLQKYQCLRENIVLYIQLEGELHDTKSRLERLSVETPINKDNFWCYYAKPMELQNTDFMFNTIEEIGRSCGFEIDCIIIDCLYQAFRGSLKDDEVIRQFIGNIRIMKAFFKCTIVVLHHMRKPSMDENQKIIDSGDNATFGSAFLKAWPDHLLLLKHDQKSNTRNLVCTTQRSGEIEAEVNLILEQPDPLFWKTLDEFPKGIVVETGKEKVINYINIQDCNEAHAKDILENTGISRSTFFGVISKELIRDGKIWKSGTGKETVYKSFSHKKYQKKD